MEVRSSAQQSKRLLSPEEVADLAELEEVDSADAGGVLDEEGQ